MMRSLTAISAAASVKWAYEPILIVSYPIPDCDCQSGTAENFVDLHNFRAFKTLRFVQPDKIALLFGMALYSPSENCYNEYRQSVRSHSFSMTLFGNVLRRKNRLFLGCVDTKPDARLFG
jgi:hypothetical protein